MKNLPGIIKVRKTNYYTQIHSHPIQQDLGHLCAIGLLAYAQSMSENYVLYKSTLYKKFTRSQVDNGIKELTKKNYWFSIQMHYKGKMVYAHYISDVVFSKEQILEEVFAMEGAKIIDVMSGYDDLMDTLKKLCNSQKDCQISVSSVAEIQQQKISGRKSTTNYNKEHYDKEHYDKEIKDVNNVNNDSTHKSSIEKPVEKNTSKDTQHLEALKATWCRQGISPNWIEEIYAQAKERGIGNKPAYVNKAATIFLDNMLKKNMPASNSYRKNGKKDIVPNWFKKPINEELSTEEQAAFMQKRSEILKQLEQPYSTPSGLFEVQ